MNNELAPGNQAIREIHAAAVIVQGFQICTPLHRGLKTKAEGKSLRCHKLKSAFECRFVVELERPEPKLGT